MRFITSIILALSVVCGSAFSAFTEPDRALLLQPNLVANGGAEQGRTGWARYADSAAVTPADGTGGSPNASTTWTVSASSPLQGAYSFVFSKDAANRQGEGVSTTFAVPAAYQAQVLTCRFDYKQSANYTGGTSAPSMRFYIYDVTNSALIEPAPMYIDAPNSTSFVSRYQGTFQVPATSTSLRAIWHVAETGTTAWTVKVDNLWCGKDTKITGPPQTDWVSFSPTMTGFGTLTNPSAFWRRIGDSIHVRGFFQGGTATAVVARLGLPSGLNVDVAKLGSTSTYTLGHITRSTTSATAFPATTVGFWAITADSTTTDSVVPSIQTDRDDGHYSFPNGTTISTSGATFSYEYIAPIVGWTNGLQFSSDADSRVVSMRSVASTTAVSTSEATVVFPTTSFDTHAAYSTSTGAYTCPTSGFYDVDSEVRVSSSTWTAGDTIVLSIRKNSTNELAHTTTFAAFTGAASGSVSGTVQCNAGETLSIRATSSQSAALTGSSVNNYFSVRRQAGPNTIAASENVHVRAYRTSTQSLTNSTLTRIDFPTVATDTHGAFNSSTGRWTCPSAGTYTISLNLTYTGNATGVRGAYIYLNGTSSSNSIAEAQHAGASSNTSAVANVSLKLVVGDFIEFWGFQSSGGALTVVGTNPGNATFSITRTGL